MNECGQRVLDTLIRPQYADLVLKPGLRSLIQERASKEAESIETVRERVLALIAGKRVVGYNVTQRLSDLGILTSLKLN